MTNPTRPDQQEQDPNWAPTPRAHAQYQRRPSSSSSSSSTSPDKRSGDTAEKDKLEKGDDDDDEEEEEEEEDEYEKRIERTGCSVENEALQMCYAETHDWRACQKEMLAFRECWKRNGNVEAEQ
ncbi:hypothetical protein BGZ70_007778 [Mortierella alpina]|uniref:CHCH domain-containing protein n=1 Tax=Mortierella alpina TaxID=64518 RepID=A0A9P6J5I7_MORAP|nr:hypothetical protein BGZ70_007778 [Mortierella alpina]